jgi:hypothetical protein
VQSQLLFSISFPEYSWEHIQSRRNNILSYYHAWLPDTTPFIDLIHQSSLLYNDIAKLNKKNQEAALIAKGNSMTRTKNAVSRNLSRRRKMS